MEVLRSTGAASGESGGLPLPSPLMIVRVAGSPSAQVFLDGGKLAAESILAVLQSQNIQNVVDVMDFGCGCGRVLRWLGGSGFRLRGVDLDRKAIAWCKTNLSGVEFDACRLTPPLRFGADSLDLIYALSVFTHIEGDAQEQWLAEFSRVLRPDRYLLVSTHGNAYRESLELREKELFDQGQPVIRFPGGAGTNLCNVFHPPEVFARMLEPRFRVVAHIPEGALGNPRQDLWLLQTRRTLTPASANNTSTMPNC